MKLLSLIICYVFFIQSAMAGLPPTTASGQADTAKTTTFNYQVPNKQATKVNGATLLETGNKNILTNPSFEHSTVLTGWTLPDSSKTAETSVVIDGKQSLKATFIGDPLNLTQDSTLYASQFAGSVQGLASIRIKTSITGLKVCARQAGVTSTSLCVNVASDNKWGLYKVPFILGATSNGIAVTSSGVAVGGDIYFDDAFVGAIDLKVDGSTIYQEEYLATWSETGISGNVASLSPITTPTLSKLVASPTINAGNIEWIVQDDVILTVGASRYDTNNLSQLDWWKNGVGLSSIYSVVTTNSPGVGGGSLQFRAKKNDVITLNVNGQSTRTGYVSLSAVKYSPSGTYSSTNADTDWQACNFASLAWQGLGTVTNNLRCRRDGGTLKIAGTFTTGTTSASVIQIPLPQWNGTALTVANSSKVAPNFVTGVMARTVVSSAIFSVHTVPSSSVLYVGIFSDNATNKTFDQGVGNGFANSGETMAINGELSIPIQGWENSNIIIGQFNGLESCKDSYECTDTFSATVSSTGVHSNENIDWISTSSAAGTGHSTINIKTGLTTAPMNCIVTSLEGAYAANSQITSMSATQINVYTHRVDAANGGSVQWYKIICQKAAPDFLAKTAKAVASDQNVRTPGVTNAVMISARVTGGGSTTNCTSSPCALENNYGSFVTSVIRVAAGVYGLYLDSSKINGMPNCVCSSVSYGNAAGYCAMYRGTGAGSYYDIVTRRSDASTGTGPAIDSVVEVVCHGVAK